MSVNIKFFKIDPIDFALNQAGQCNKAGALKTLKAIYSLSPQEIKRIQEILNAFQPNTFGTGEPALKRNILKVLPKESFRTRCHRILAQPLPDIVHLIFAKSLITDNFKDLTALSCMNNHWYQCSKAFWTKFDLKQFNPQLKILDAKTLGMKVHDEPLINKFDVVKNFRNLADEVEDKRGLTVLTMCKGLTFNQLVKIAAEAGITVNFIPNEIEQELGDEPVVKTYIIQITNSIFINSRKLDCDESIITDCFEQKMYAMKHSYEEPTALEYATLCIFTKKVFKECPYDMSDVSELPTFGQSSTYVEGQALVVGYWGLHLDVRSYELCSPERIGAGGRRKLG